MGEHPASDDADAVARYEAAEALQYRCCTVPKETLLQESVRETKETLRRFAAHNRQFTIMLVAIVVAVVGVVVGLSRPDGEDPGTTLRADQKTLVTAGDNDFKNDAGSDVTYPNALVPGGGGGSATTGNTIDAMKGINANVRAPARTVVTKPDGTPVTTKDGVVVTTIVESDPSSGGGGSTNTTKPSGGGGGSTNTTVGSGGFNPAAFNSGRIAYVSGGATWTVNPDGTDPLRVAGSAFFPAWSRGRTSLAVADKDNPGGSLSYISYTGGRFALTTGPSGSSNGDSAPAWSPSGDQVVFSRIDMNASDRYSSIWVVNRDGSGLRRIAISGCFNRDPTWSPDGNRIVFWSSRDHCGENGQPLTGEYELYSMNVDGIGVTRLGTATNSDAPSFSPDGQSIAFASDRSGNFEIYVMNVDGSEQTRLTTSSAEDTYPTWSPDGSRIAFRSSRNGGGIFTMKDDGSDVRFVIAGSQPAWS